MHKKKAWDDAIVNCYRGIAKRLTLKLNNPPPHAEAYISLTHLYKGWENTSTAKAFLVASKSLKVENWRFSITGLEAKRFQINMSVMHTTIHHAA